MLRHVDVPEEVSSSLAKQMQGTKRRTSQSGIDSRNEKREHKPKYIPVVVVVNSHSARTTLVPAGGGRYRLEINTELRKAVQADVGDVISVELRLDIASRSLPVPGDLRAGLKDHPKAWKAFEALAPGQRRQFIQWFDSAKAPETRRKRLARAIDILLERALLSRSNRSKPTT